MKPCGANTERLYGFRVKLYPTEEDKARLNEIIDLYRYVYNWTIGTIEQYFALSDQIIKINNTCELFAEKRNAPGNEWLQKIPINTARHAIMSAYAGYSFYWKKKGNRPSYKTKKNSNKYFKLRGERIYFRGDSVGFEGLGRNHKIKCGHTHVPVGPNIRYYNCGIHFDGYDYWLCLCTEMVSPIIPNPQTGPIGIDLGLRKLATLSDGTEYHIPDISVYVKREKKLNRKLNKDYRKRLELANQAKTKLDEIPKTKNMLKREAAFRKMKDRTRNIRHTYVSTMTTEIVRKAPSAIVLETLNVKGMLRNKYLAHHISESLFSTIRHQLEYKCKEAEIPIILADRFYPSSQICSNCGNIHKIGKATVYKCPKCGLVIDRDLNAAINLKNLANDYTT